MTFPRIWSFTCTLGYSQPIFGLVIWFDLSGGIWLHFKTQNKDDDASSIIISMGCIYFEAHLIYIYIYIYIYGKVSNAYQDNCSKINKSHIFKHNPGAPKGSSIEHAGIQELLLKDNNYKYDVIILDFQPRNFSLHSRIYIYIYIRVCVCLCLCIWVCLYW